MLKGVSTLPMYWTLHKMHPSNKWDILHFNSWKILNEFLFLDLQKDFIFLRDCNKLHPAYDVGWLAMSYFSLICCFCILPLLNLLPPIIPQRFHLIRFLMEEAVINNLFSENYCLYLLAAVNKLLLKCSKIHLIIYFF